MKATLNYGCLKVLSIALYCLFNDAIKVPSVIPDNINIIKAIIVLCPRTKLGHHTSLLD